MSDPNTIHWTLDPAHSEITFKVKHLMMTSVTGRFERFGAEITAIGDDLSHAHVDFWAETASVNTGNADRDKHLKSPDFFDTVKYPRIGFKGVRAEAVDGDGSWTLHGELIINGIAKPVRLDVEWGGVVKDPWGNVKAGVKLNGKLDRSQWNLVWNTALDSGGVLVSDEVRIACEVQLVRQA